MSDYWFFMSYARSDPDIVHQFYTGLAKQVYDLVGLPSEFNEREIGFIDEENIEPGDYWPEVLRKALQNSKIFVCLYSPRYFKSEYCGKEFQVFLSRLNSHKKQAAKAKFVPRVIMPVWWVPVAKEDQPGVITEIQSKHKDFGKLYAKEGLQQLMRLNKYKDEYTEFLREFAKRLVKTAKKISLLKLETFQPLKEIKSAFEEATKPASGSSRIGPKTAQFVFVAGRKDELKFIRKDINFYGDGGGKDWRPYFPLLDRAIGIVAQEIAATEEFHYEVIPMDDSFVQRIKEAEKNNNVVVIIVDTWTIRIEKYHQLMREYDNEISLNCVILILLNKDDNESARHLDTLRTALKKTFQIASTRQRKYYRETGGSPEKLRKELPKALNAVQTSILRRSEVIKKAEADEIIVQLPML